MTVVDPALSLAFAAAFLGGAALTSLALLRGWRGWLALKRLELERRSGVPSPLSRFDIFELKERVRRLEAIAEGRED